MKKFFISLSFIFLALINLYASPSSDRAIILVSTDSSIAKEYKSLIEMVINSTLKEKVREYTDFEIIDAQNQDKIFALQAKSESEAFDASTAVEIGKLANANYAFFTRISFADNKYLLFIDLTDLTTGINDANILIRKDTLEELYSLPSCAINEAIVSICQQIGKTLSKEQIIELLGEEKEIVQEFSTIDSFTLKNAEDDIFDLGNYTEGEEKIDTLLERYPDNIYLKNLKVFCLGQLLPFKKFLKSNPYKKEQLIANYLVPIDYYLNIDLDKANEYLSKADKLFPKNIIIQSRLVYYFFHKQLLDKNNSEYNAAIASIMNNMKKPTTKLERSYKERALAFSNGIYLSYDSKTCKALDIYERETNRYKIQVSEKSPAPFNTLETALEAVSKCAMLELTDPDYKFESKLEINKPVFVFGNVNQQTTMTLSDYISINVPCTFVDITFRNLYSASSFFFYSTILTGGLVRVNADCQFGRCTFTSTKNNGLYISNTPSNVILNNCTIKGNEHSGIIANNSYTTIISSTICDNSSNGIYLSSSTSLLVKDSIISNNTEDGIAMTDNSSCLIDNCNILKNNQGISTKGNSYTKIQNSMIYINKENGIRCSEQSTVTCDNSNVYNNNVSGIYVYGNAKLEANDSKIYLNKNFGLSTAGSSNNIAKNCNFYKNGYSGVVTGEQAFTKIENSNSHDNQQIGFFASGSSSLVISNCRSYNNLMFGIAGGGTSKTNATNCEIYSNSYSGVTADESAVVKVDKSKSYKNKELGFFAVKNGHLEVTNSSAYENQKGNLLKKDNAILNYNGKRM